VTEYRLRQTTGKVFTVAEFTAAADPKDAAAVALLHRDECAARRLDPDRHRLQSYNPRRGWIDHGGTT
jgi:hypothetical protein